MTPTAGSMAGAPGLKAGVRSSFVAPLVCALIVIAYTGPSSSPATVFAHVAGPSQVGSLAASARMTDTTAMAARWAASPLLVSPQRDVAPLFRPTEPATTTDRDDANDTSAIDPSYLLIGAAAIGVLGVSLLESLFFALIQAIDSRSRKASPKSGGSASTRTPIDYEARSRRLLHNMAPLWTRAETSVFDLDEPLPLRALLLNEMKQISQRLAAERSAQTVSRGALTVTHTEPYWRSLSQRLNQSTRDLQRICAVAEAAGAGFGSRTSEPRIPRTRDEACFILGANRNVEAETVQRLVKALRQCWHPDLAQTEQDRSYRDARMMQINAAYDLITGKRAEG